MPKYLVIIEAEKIGYPFYIEASEQGRALASIKRYWERQGWGDYDAIRIETLKKGRDGIARPMRYTPQVYSRVQALVHTCLLDMQEGQVDRDHVLRQLCQVLTEVVPASIAQEVFEIVDTHERAGHAVEVAETTVRPILLPSARLLVEEALADGMYGEREKTSDASGGAADARASSTRNIG